VIEYLSCDDLNILEENLIFDAALKWLKFDLQERTDDVADIMNCVRLPFVKPEYLKLLATVEPIIYENKKCIRQVFKIT